jgi:hypothetical protein
VIALGENDACGGTPLSVFSREFADVLALLTRRLPQAHVIVLSIENVANQWRALEANREDRTALKDGYMLDCSLGGTPTPAKLSSVASDIAAYNDKLQAICRASVRRQYDGGAVYRMRFTARDFSTYDLQHLSIAGQHALSAVAWTGYRFSAP